MKITLIYFQVKNLSKALDELEEYWTALPFIAGYKLSFADLYAACEVEQASEWTRQFASFSDLLINAFRFRAFGD